jgi:hypothetical protein
VEENSKQLNLYKIKSMNTTEILDAIKAEVAILETEHAKTSKAARGRARSAANSIKKLAAEFKKTSTAEDKAA